MFILSIRQQLLPNEQVLQVSNNDIINDDITMMSLCRCNTCGSSDNDAICSNCINTCHKGHDIQYVRYDR